MARGAAARGADDGTTGSRGIRELVVQLCAVEDALRTSSEAGDAERVASLRREEAGLLAALRACHLGPTPQAEEQAG
jgi:hypothetical protein